MPQLNALSEPECRRLVGLDEIGRVAVSTPDGPHIVPVTYVVAGDALVFATAAASELGRQAVGGATMAVEVDQLDYESGHGWSVVVRGRVSVLDAERAEGPVEGLAGAPRPRPWADGARTLLVRVAMERLSGRRLGWGWQPMPPRTSRTGRPAPSAGAGGR